MKNIDREHPEYVARRGMWRKYGDLYAGGEQLRERASEYLVRRSKEPREVFDERLSRVFYENYIGSIIDWYAATLLRREPVLAIEGPNEQGKKFFQQFVEDCDLKGTNLSEFFRRQLSRALVYGTSYVTVDFPRASVLARNRAEEDAAGQSRAYLADYTPDEVINWNRDADGALQWIVLRTSTLTQREVSDDRWTRETRWIYYDREEFRIFSRVDDEKEAEIRLIDQGRHGLAALGRVPVFPIVIPEGLWLMNKAALLQMEHFNKSNALSWALTMGLFATPVVYSDREWNQIAGESYYIQLGPEDRFGWTEPEGHVFQIAADNLERLKTEIYRVSYLLTQAGNGRTAELAQSGLSKLRDFSITHEVLRAYGDAVKETMGQVLRAIGMARKDGLFLEVSGLDEFDIGDFSSELEDAKRLLDLNIGSATLRKQVYKKLALTYLSDARQEVKSRIVEEIEGSFLE